MEMVIEVPQSRIEVEYRSVFDRIAKNAKVDGFRKGKAPLKLIENMFLKEATSEVLEKLLKTTYIEALDSKNYRPIGMPSFNYDSFEREKPLKYTVRFEVMPTVELGSYKGIAVKERVCQVRDDDVEKEINNLREKYARISKKEEDARVEKGDLLRFGVKRIDNVKPEEVDALAFKDYTIIVGKSDSEYALDRHVLGLSVGQTREVTIKYPKDYELNDLAGQKVTYVVKVEEISRMDLPNPDDEFAKDVSNFTTIEELRQNIRSYFEKASANAAKGEVIETIKNAIIEKCTFDIPESLVKAEESGLLQRLAKRFNVEVTTAEEFSKKTGFPVDELKMRLHAEAEKDVKWEIARLEIAKTEKMEVSEEEYRNELESMKESNGVSMEELEKYIEHNHLRDGIEHDILLTKVNDFLYNSANIEKLKPISYFEFMNENKRA